MAPLNIGPSMGRKRDPCIIHDEDWLRADVTSPVLRPVNAEYPGIG